VDVRGKTILVTGAGRGIGRSLARHFAGKGANLALLDMNATDVEETQAQCAQTGAVARSYIGDAANEDDVVGAVDQMTADFGRLDGLINNAGIVIWEDLSDIGHLEQQLDVNLLGPLRMVHAFLPLLTPSNGAIVNILSMTSLAPLPLIPGYSISKAGALSMTQSLRSILAPRGVSVYGVILASVDTEMTRDMDVPKVSPESAAKGIFDGLERGDEEIFPDPNSQPFEEGWRNGVSKALERHISTLKLEVPGTKV